MPVASGDEILRCAQDDMEFWMDYRRLGRSGLKVSEICLGTMTFGQRQTA